MTHVAVDAILISLLTMNQPTPGGTILAFAGQHYMENIFSYLHQHGLYCVAGVWVCC